jgi:hypothetical protein
MKSPSQKLLFLSLFILVVSQAGCETDPTYKKLNLYDTWSRSSGHWKKPPWIPGTDGQKEVKVQVLDSTTMEPIAGAIVVGGYYGLDSRGGYSCVRSESAVSDAQGWATLPNDQDERVQGSSNGRFGPLLESAYKRGYQMSIDVYKTTSGGNNEWYVRRSKPAPLGTHGSQTEISVQNFSDEHKAALLETKERSRIYLMPSTARTKEEREKELNVITQACLYTMPFEFSESKGILALWEAVYQEELDIGFTGRNSKRILDNTEKSYLEFRQRTAKEKSQ